MAGRCRVKGGDGVSATAHTQARYKNAFYAPFLHDRRNFGTWEEAGSEDIVKRAHRLWKQIIKAYKQPPLEPAIKEALQAFITRRAVELENVALYD